ncbi:peptide chain release factor N(5)-glutamine methyltransferase [Salinifilum aidingensis]
MSPQSLRTVLAEVTDVLAEAGVPTPRVDAELLAAHALGVERGRLLLVRELDGSTAERLRELARQRARRVPLQHVTGSAVLGRVELRVGPGVFVPRPETELLLTRGLALVEGVRAPVVVDLCTGSGALALGFAHERADAQVHAVDNAPRALEWARRNAAERAAAGDPPVAVHGGDVGDPAVLAHLDGAVDLVLCNPPYVPEGTEVPAEVAEHDPAAAVFAGADGLQVIRHVAACAARLLRPGGGVAVEHDDTHGDAVPELFRAAGFTEVSAREDLAGRPRFVTARWPAAQ